MTDDAALLSTLIRHAPMGMAFVDLEFRFKLINDRLAAINGLPPAAHLGRTVEHVVPQLWPTLAPIYRRVVDTGRAVTDVEISGVVGSTPGETRHFLQGFYPVLGPDGALTGIGVMVVDLTEQRQAEANHSAVLAAMPDFIFDLARDGTHLSFHAPQEDALFVQADRILGRRVRDILPADVSDKYEHFIERTLATGQKQGFEYSLTYDGHGPKTFDASMVPKGADEVLVVVRDISDRIKAEQARRQLEEQLRQSQKMEAIGQLAGGVAHDFNNLLTVINGYSNMVLTSLPSESPVRDLLEEVRKAGERAASLTRQLLMFSRQEVIEPRVLDLNAIVTDADSMLRRLIAEDVHITRVLQPGLTPIKADAGQIEQVLVNLCVNARDAMPGGGRLTIETTNVTVDAARARTLNVPAGGYAMVSVTDTGTGMDEGTKARLFEPFFTTKGRGKGTGLGLPVVFGVVKESGGHIEVVTALGKGTSFRLYFPEAAGVVTERAMPAPKQGVSLGHETILLVEDDAEVRGLARMSLKRSGYDVLEAADGDEAVRLLQTLDRPIDLLLSDVVMPNLGGRELASMVRAMRPSIRVLFLSGYTGDVVLRHGIEASAVEFLQKPFTPAGLTSKVREVLDRR